MFERAADQFQSDPVVHGGCEAPESRLMLAVLQDAMLTFQRGLCTSDPKELEAYREVDRWFRSRDYDSPFSFESICGTLGVDPACVRDGLRRLRHAAFSNRPVPRWRAIARERTYERRIWGSPVG